MLAIVVHGVPYLWERIRDDVQDGHASDHERDVVVLDVAPQKLPRHPFGLGEEGLGRRGRVQEAELAHPRLDAGQVLVGPVRVGKVRGHVRVRRAEEVEQHKDVNGGEGRAARRRRRVRLALPDLCQGPRAVEGVGGAPRLPGLLAVEQDNLHAAVLLEARPGLAALPHVLPLLRQGRVDAARHVQEHGARRRAVHGPDETLGPVQAVVVSGQGQAAHVARERPRGIAREDEARKGYLAVAGRGRLGGRVVPVDAPVREVHAEELDKVALDGGRAGGARDPGDQDRGKQGARVDVKVVAAVGD